MALEDLLGAALALTPEQRERLADEILVSVAHDRGHDDHAAALEPDPELTAELEHRLAALDRGEAKTVSLEEARARVAQRLASVRRP
jgi:putative addiction module component (TIGR02574 family)